MAVNDEAAEGWEELMGQNIVIKSLEAGEGELPELGQIVVYDFTGRILPGRSVYATRKDARLYLGDGDDTPGVELALRYMRPGQRALVRVTSRFAYGAVGRPACLPGEVAVPPDADVEVELRLTAALSPKDPGQMTPQEKLQDCQERKAQGVEHYKYGQHKKALRCFSVIMDKFKADDFAPDSEDFNAAVRLLVDCGNNIATCHAALGDVPKARQAAYGVLSIDKDNVKALVRVGQTCVTLDDFDEAQLRLSRALELNPNSSDAKAELRRLQAKRQEYRKKTKEMQQRMSAQLLGSGSTTAATVGADGSLGAESESSSAVGSPARGIGLGLKHTARNGAAAAATVKGPAEVLLPPKQRRASVLLWLVAALVAAAALLLARYLPLAWPGINGT